MKLSRSTIRIGLAVTAAVFVPGGLVWAAPTPTEQQMHDRLLGKSTAASACSTPEAIESDPNCAGPSGDARPWSLTGQADKVGSRRRPAGHVRPSRAAQGAHRSGATPCDLNQAGDARSLNLCLTFARNSAVQTPASKVNLAHLAAVLAEPDLRSRKVGIDGYADASGRARLNRILSERRAQSAADYLVAHGVSADRLAARGWGATHPVPGHDPFDPVNRRVEARLAD